MLIELSNADLDKNLNNHITLIPQSFLPGMSVSREFIGLRNGSEVSFAPKGEGRRIETTTLVDSFDAGHAGSLVTIHATSAEKFVRSFASQVVRNYTQTAFCERKQRSEKQLILSYMSSDSLDAAASASVPRLDS